ncbi:hypothetical protein QUB65_05490 [Microcoleus sp. A2-D2]|uniref:hypothetical protein n=1 Tax=unclassified Microcoleus TaxID=2642155 RepID=UPI002FD77E5E
MSVVSCQLTGGRGKFGSGFCNGRRKTEEGRRKKEDGRRKKKDGRRKIFPISPSPHLPISPSPHLPISPSPHLPISLSPHLPLASPRDCQPFYLLIPN